MPLLFIENTLKTKRLMETLQEMKTFACNTKVLDHPKQEEGTTLIL